MPSPARSALCMPVTVTLEGEWNFMLFALCLWLLLLGCEFNLFKYVRARRGPSQRALDLKRNLFGCWQVYILYTVYISNTIYDLFYHDDIKCHTVGRDACELYHLPRYFHFGSAISATYTPSTRGRHQCSAASCTTSGSECSSRRPSSCWRGSSQ